MLKETVGSQDQVCAAYGGVNRISFLQNGGFTVQPMTLTQERLAELNSHLMLFYTGIKRTASEVASSYVAGMEERAALLTRMRDYVEQSCAILNSGRSLAAFGELLHQAWLAKRALSDKVSNAPRGRVVRRTRGRRARSAENSWARAAADSSCCLCRRKNRPKSASSSTG